MNFTAEDFARGLYFSTWTFNNSQKELKFSFASWTSQGKKCVFDNCQSEHFYQTVPTSLSSFLAERRIAKKRLNHDQEGVNDLFASAISTIQKLWQPTNFKWVAVPELHKCQTPCHWPKKKSKKSSWKQHNESACSHPEKHICLRNWHVHMLSTDFLPAKYHHQKCGLGKYTDAGSPSGCWDHRAYIAHDIWPYGLVDIKRVSHLKVQGKPIRSAEGLTLYLIKYLAKSFQMRQNKELANKVGLLPGMGVYKFFRNIYGYEGDKTYIAQKRKKPLITSQVYINDDYNFNQEVEKEFGDYFDQNLHLKKDVRKIFLKKEKLSDFSNKKDWKLTQILKLCLLHSSRSKIKKNQFWKPCDTSQDPSWKKDQGWQVHCPIAHQHHTEPLIRWEFEFKGKQSYLAFTNQIKPALSKLNLPSFAKFQDFQVQSQDYAKFARESSLPWNKAIREYEPVEESGESWEDKEWQDSNPTELLYNHIYLKEIRSQISNRDYSWELSADDAIKRYADY